MSKFPKNTELSLKNIVENLDVLTTKLMQEETPKLTVQQKQQLREMASMFNEYGKIYVGEEKFLHAAKAISDCFKLAETYAMNESGDVLQSNVVKRDFQEANKKIQIFNKLTKECYARMQELGVLYEDLHHVMERYFEIQNEAALPTSDAPPIESTPLQ